MDSFIGHLAPAFNLIATDRKLVSLSSLRGEKVVLLFFPAAFSSTCDSEMCYLRDNFAEYKKLDAKIFGISTDTFWTLAKYKEDQKIPFELLSDFNKIASRAYNSLYEEFILGMLGVTKRSSFVLDRQGVIRHQEILESANILPNFEEIRRTLQEMA
ncbi:MAG: peroxiredoxin [Saprospiraceae bacterium]